MSTRTEPTREIEDAPKIQLTAMIDIVFLLLVFFMLMKFKTLEKRIDTFLPKTEGPASSTAREPVRQLRVRIELLPGSADRVLIVPEPVGGVFAPIPQRETPSALFDEFAAMLRAGLASVGEKVEIAADEAVPFEFVAGIVDRVQLVNAEQSADVVPKRVTFRVPAWSSDGR